MASKGILSLTLKIDGQLFKPFERGISENNNDIETETAVWNFDIENEFIGLQAW